MLDNTDQIESEDDGAAVLRKLIAGLQSGEINAVTMRSMIGGVEKTFDLRYGTEEEKAVALANLLGMLGQLH